MLRTHVSHSLTSKRKRDTVAWDVNCNHLKLFETMEKHLIYDESLYFEWWWLLKTMAASLLHDVSSSVFFFFLHFFFMLFVRSNKCALRCLSQIQLCYNGRDNVHWVTLIQIVFHFIYGTMIWALYVIQMWMHTMHTIRLIRKRKRKCFYEFHEKKDHFSMTNSVF